MSFLSTSLSFLASITGVLSQQNYVMTNYDWSIINSFIEENVSINSVKDIYNVFGENQYLEVSLTDGYLIYDKKDKRICDYSYNSMKSLYSDENLNIYNETGNNNYISFKDGAFTDLKTDKIILKEDIYENYNNSVNANSSITKISNSFYFEKLGDNIAHNTNGTCGIVALEILLGYYDSLYNDFFVNEHYDIKSISSIQYSNIRLFDKSPGVDTMQNRQFHDYLITLAEKKLAIFPNTGLGMTGTQLLELTKYYLKIQNISAQINSSEGFVSDLLNERFKTVVKTAIDNDRPLIVAGDGHFSVAYGYDENNLYVCSGWGTSDTIDGLRVFPWSDFTVHGTKVGVAAIDIEYTGPHYHSNNYYCSNNDTYVCSCGLKQKETSSSLYYKNDINFGPASNKVKKSFTLNKPSNIEQYSNFTVDFSMYLWKNNYFAPSEVYIRIYDGQNQIEGIIVDIYDNNARLYYLGFKKYYLLSNYNIFQSSIITIEIEYDTQGQLFKTIGSSELNLTMRFYKSV